MPVAVVKLGSSIVAEENGELRLSVVARICEEVAALHRAGVDVVVVTSGRDRPRHAAARPGRAPGRGPGAAGGQRGRPGPALPHLRRAAARARHPVGAGAAHVLRHERPHALPERAPHAAQAARVADRAGDQRERHDDDRRDLVRRQRLPRRPGGGARRTPTLLVLLTDTEGLYTADPRTAPDARLVEEVTDPESLRGCTSATRPRRSARAACARRSWPPRWRRRPASRP